MFKTICLVGCALVHSLTAKLLAADLSSAPIQLRDEKLSSRRSFQFSFDAISGENYPIAVSIDLLHWALLTNRTGTGTLVIEDSGASNFPVRFYHVGIPTPLPIPLKNMVFISQGSFTMGSPASELGRDANEGPPTLVTLSHGFWIGKYEVSQVEYINLMGTNLAFFSYDTRLPVDAATWQKATNYCSRLTQAERAAGRLPAGYVYRLPTEAEWEYACRAGTTTPVGVGNGTNLSSAQANFDGTFPYAGAPAGQNRKVTTIGGTFPPNAWGLYDMHGNVWEWCQDWYAPYPGGAVTDPKGPPTGTTRVLRGGGYTSAGQGCRSAKRDSRSESYGNVIQGFRVVLARDP